MIKTFIYDDKFSIIGRGTVYTGCTEKNPGFGCSVGDLVVVDGQLMQVNGIETFMHGSIKPPANLGNNFGLHLRPAPVLDQLALVDDPRGDQ